MEVLSVVVEVATRVWDVWRSKRAPFNTDEFVKTYSDLLRQSIDLVPNLMPREVILALKKDELTNEQRADGARTILRAMSEVVKGFHRKRNVVINASYMIAVPPEERHLDAQPKFVRPGRRADSYSCFLELQDWADSVEGLPQEFSLPVEKNRMGEPDPDPPLFGAPWAYVNNQTYVVRDTLRIAKKLDKGLHPDVARRIKTYFEAQKHRLRSFASFPVQAPLQLSNDGRVVAVVNIQSNKTSILGFFGGNQRKLELTLLPFFHILSYYLVKPRNTPASRSAN